MARLGAHVSVAGGLPLALPRAADLGCECAQIFVKNASRWQAPPLDPSVASQFTAAWGDSSVGAIVAHAAYLINLASPKPEVRERSIEALADELTRCRRLGLDGLVFHPGAHLGSGEASGLAAIAAGIDEVLSTVPEGRSRLLLETTAGQGTVLGYRLEQLQEILELVKGSDAVAVCLDTCHLLAAGYAVDAPEGMGDVLDEVFERFGSERLACVHVNGSLHPRGSRKDRHCNLGDGYLGVTPLEVLVNDSRLELAPLILETPVGDDGEGHRRDLEILRSMRSGVE
ncbi:MAG: deoxyribonuclease IV [Thermoanaerobaculia bacterium]|nr:deoxyribonuclease IV [Thermoanaerobaculia bacterium]